MIHEKLFSVAEQVKELEDQVHELTCCVQWLVDKSNMFDEYGMCSLPRKVGTIHRHESMIAYMAELRG